MDKILKEHFDRFMRKGELPPELQKLNEEVSMSCPKDPLILSLNLLSASMLKSVLPILSTNWHGPKGGDLE